MLNTFFDQIYLINLNKRPRRRLTMLQEMDQLGIKVKVVPAVDGSQIDPSERLRAERKYISVWAQKSNKNKYREPPTLSTGEYGYFLTWKNILEEAKRVGHQRILCLDDDVWFHQNWQQLWTDLIKRIRKDWVILYLGASQHGQKIDWDKAQKNHIYTPHATDGSFAVGLSKTGIDLILKDIQTGRIGTVDSTILRKIFLQVSDRCYVAYPNIVIADLTTSDLRHSRDQAVAAKKFHWNLEHYLWKQLELPLISVILPVYQAETTIWNSILSLLNQTYPKLEIIVIDDGSTDQSWKIIDNIAKRLSTATPDQDSGATSGEGVRSTSGEGVRSTSGEGGRIDEWSNFEKVRRMVIEKSPVNQGCYSARNRGLKLATGSIIAFQDADDVSLCYRLEEQIRYLWQTQVEWTQCLILRTHLDQLDLSQESKLMMDIESQRIHRQSSGYYKHCCSAVLGMVTGLFRKRVFDKVGFFLELKCGADAEFGERLLREYATVHLTEQQNVVTYLTEIGEIPKVFFKINRIMYLCHQMNDNNLTLKFPLINRNKTDWIK